MKTRNNAEIIPPIEYDQLLEDFLLENSIDASNITDICKTGLSTEHIIRKEILSTVKSLRVNKKIGCIFTLPTNRRDGSCWIFYSSMSSNEIRRMVAMKVFL